MNKCDIYLYGMVLQTNSYLLKEKFPEPDNYSEFTQKYTLIGGETGTAAAVLASLGCSVRMAGNHMGYGVFPTIRDYFADKSVDISPLEYFADYPGLEDNVFNDGETRTCFGMFQTYYSEPVGRWSKPRAEDIEGVKAAGIDPFFRGEAELAAELCHERGIPYVTIDCRFDSKMNKLASVNVISDEFVRTDYPEYLDNKAALYEKYLENTDGLVIFTHGSKEVNYGRKATGLKGCMPFKIKPVSTLGAGDTYKAGCVYGLYKGMSDDELVRFACGCSAAACLAYPIPLDPPTLERVEKIMSGSTTL